MITLITGVPGSGKSLYAIWSLLPELKRGRRLLVDGVKDLAIDHVMVDEPWIREWHKHVEPNDIVFIDEVQRIWPPVSVSTKPTEDIEKLHVHRHLGVDFVLVTQNPQRMNKTVRDLVGRHVHVRRLFGMNRAMLYEWDSCHNVSNLRDAVKTSWRYPRDVFRLYTSAELHTKPKAVIPKSLFIVPVLAVATVVLGYSGFRMIHGGFGHANASKSGASGVSSSAGAAAAPLAGSAVVSDDWRVAGRYADGVRGYVVLVNGRGALRLEDSAGFKGDGVLTSGVVDGRRVASWSGASSAVAVSK
ncbi:hypothetical protein GXB81_05540 [Paraburkholderia sp. Ac-20336]|uniref:zonular occludens toxin domain-containing protein n=1 Tax=Paraburkholderia sp. Ac-20336 TaxID=2703886 RepID=UPI00197FC355|nr:zonular occludens toxin domain-containing protein [Paraburkholderia sp. Ac-20336]MBN3802519.1 hypothetical protein [Paraburkholderia sp. Ac-20336]